MIIAELGRRLKKRLRESAVIRESDAACAEFSQMVGRGRIARGPRGEMAVVYGDIRLADDWKFTPDASATTQPKPPEQL